MNRTRRKLTARFKATEAIEALKEQQTMAELAIRYQIHPNQISMWKKEFSECADMAFTTAGTAGELGSGLGLVFVRDLVQRNGGRISVESTEGKGTTFSVALPMA